MALDVAECGNGSLLCEMSSCVGTEQTSLPSEKVEKKRKWSEGKFLYNLLRYSTTAQGLEGNSVAWYLLRDGFFLVLVGYLFFQVSLRKPRTVDDAPIHHADSP